jgi:hypothetical protein
MIERRKNLSFAVESRQAFSILCERFWQYFDRDFAIQLRVARSVDLTHPARAERRDDLVGTKFRAYRQSRGSNPLKTY